MWTDDEVQTLGDLAASAVTEIELRLEVARQRQLQESLRESEARFRVFVDSVQDYAILMLDAEGCILGWSRGAEALTGYPRNEVVGHHFSTLLPAGHEHADRAERLAMAALTRGHVEDEGWMVRRGASPFWGSTAVTALRKHDGDLIGYAMLTRDLTERRRVEATLHDAHAALEERVEEFLNALLESLAEGIVACDAEGRLTLFNRATRELHGLPPESLPPELYAEHYSLYHPDGRTPMEPDRVPLLRALKGEVVRGVEMVIAPRGREPRRLLANGRAIFNAQGEKLGAVVAMHDITERALAEQELVRLSRRHELILQTAADGIIGIDTGGRATFVNPAGARMLGHEAAELVGQPLHALVHHSHSDGSTYPWDECPIHATIREGTPRQVDHDVLWRKGGAPHSRPSAPAHPWWRTAA